MIDSDEAQGVLVIACDDTGRGHGRIDLYRGRVQPNVPVHISCPLDEPNLQGRKTEEAGHFNGRFRVAEVTTVEVQLIEPTLPVAVMVDNVRLVARGTEDLSADASATPREAPLGPGDDTGHSAGARR